MGDHTRRCYHGTRSHHGILAGHFGGRDLLSDGRGLLAAGIYEIIRYFDLGLIGVLFRYDLFLGIMSVLAGVLLLLHPNGALVILPVILGFYIILASVFSIQISTEARHFGFSGWWGALLLRHRGRGTRRADDL